MFKKKAQIIKWDQSLCNADLDNNEVLFVRAVDKVTRPDALLEVPVQANAIVVKDGGTVEYFRSGTHRILKNKEEIKNWKRGSSVDIIFIPKDTRLPVKWGTNSRIRYRDESSNKVITVGARGEFDVGVSNPEQFFRRVVGNKKEFNRDEFSARFRDTVVNEFTDLFLKVVDEKKITYDKFTACKKEIGDQIAEILEKVFTETWGLSVLRFIINDFDFDEDDLEAIEEAAAARALSDKEEE